MTHTLALMVAALAPADGPPPAWSADPPAAWSAPAPPASKAPAFHEEVDRHGVRWRIPAGYTLHPSLKPSPKAAPGVAAPTFPGFDSDHRCDGCGAFQFTVAGWNRDGTHTHVCAYCGRSWRH